MARKRGLILIHFGLISRIIFSNVNSFLHLSRVYFAIERERGRERCIFISLMSRCLVSRILNGILIFYVLCFFSVCFIPAISCPSFFKICHIHTCAHSHATQVGFCQFLYFRLILVTTPMFTILPQIALPRCHDMILWQMCHPRI